jgi:hypothetical protein
MKSLARRFNPDYKNEVTNLMALKRAKAVGVVRYLGSFKHPDWEPYQDAPPRYDEIPQRSPESSPVVHVTDSMSNAEEGPGRSSCHIFFEYGDGDLLHLFECSPPSHPFEIQSFWHDLIRVVEALAEIHSLSIPDQSRTSVGV